MTTEHVFNSTFNKQLFQKKIVMLFSRSWKDKNDMELLNLPFRGSVSLVQRVKISVTGVFLIVK